VQTAIAPDISARESATSLASEGWTLENLIAGRVAGASAALTSTRGLQIRIRGSDNPPLVIVDGTPLDNSSIPLINSYDIERIEVLKNPADVALYGARGANGVVRITTRRPGSPPAPAR
jgi:TonB-dependent SusC/RagA subfamily outer membrane receptor